jgi:hypothetical protein
MQGIWIGIVAWFKSKGGFAHVTAAVYAMAVLAYAQVPAFQNLCNTVYGDMPSWLHEWLLAAVGIAAWYKTTNSAVNTAPPPTSQS